MGVSRLPCAEEWPARGETPVTEGRRRIQFSRLMR